MLSTLTELLRRLTPSLFSYWSWFSYNNCLLNACKSRCYGVCWRFLKKINWYYIYAPYLHIQKLGQGSIFPLPMRFVALSKKCFRSKNRRFLKFCRRQVPLYALRRCLPSYIYIRIRKNTKIFAYLSNNAGMGFKRVSKFFSLK